MPTDTLTAIETLHRETRAQRNRLYNAIVNRREHPTYGYTKKGILEDLAVLEGMLFACWIIRNSAGHGSMLMAIREEAELVLEESIDVIRQRAASA